MKKLQNNTKDKRKEKDEKIITTEKMKVCLTSSPEKSSEILGNKWMDDLGRTHISARHSVVIMMTTTFKIENIT